MTEESQGSLLVVDDNEMNRDMLSRRLERKGYEVTVAEGGAEAIELLEEKLFDTVLLDIMMPEINGWDVLEWLRKRHTNSQLPVIMATAKDSSEDIVKSLKLGANDYVTKPLDMKVVLARVDTQVSLKHATELLEETNAQLSSANEKLKRDLESAANVQQSELPPKSPQLEGCSVAWAYRPCDELGGDFLDVFNIDERHIGMYLLDVSGHGVSAALMSVAVSRALKPSPTDTCVVSKPDRSSEDQSLKIASPSQVAEKLNERFPSHSGLGQYFTFIYGIFDTEMRELNYCCAGHLSPALIRADGSVELVETQTGFPVGLVQQHDTGYTRCPEMRLALSPGDRIVFYSDGVTEAKNSDGDFLGEETLLESLRENAHLSLDECVTSLQKRVVEWGEPKPPNDDVSILAFEVE